MEQCLGEHDALRLPTGQFLAPLVSLIRQHNLGEALKEACSMDPSKANTGELIQIEELLAIANESAKKAISVRRRLKLGKKS